VIAERHKILIHRAIDGELSEPERRELDSLLESSAEAQEFYRQVADLAVLPSLLPASDAPADLKTRILNEAVRTRQTSTRRAAPPQTLGALLGSLFTPRLVYGLAAGLVIGIGLGALVLKGPISQIDSMDLSGTIIAGDDPTHLRRVDSDSFAEAEAKGRLAVDVKDGLTYIQVEIESTTEVSVVVDFGRDPHVQYWHEPVCVCARANAPH
jgi:anti-sigma factor RsiW